MPRRGFSVSTINKCTGVTSMREPLNNGHFIEALERGYLLGEIVELMSNHPVFAQYPELKIRLDELTLPRLKYGGF
jgi:hypothetical protein